MYSEAREWASLPERRITWHQAISLMKAHNLELEEADDQIALAERQSLSVYTNLIPGLSYYGYMTRSISELTNPLDSQDLTSRINITFNLPELTRLPYEVYSSKVGVFMALKAKEGKMRELVSRLYQLVRQREVEAAKRELAAGQPEAQAETAQQKLSRQQADERHWREVARLLGVNDARWSIAPSSMPHVNWEEYNAKLDKLGELVVCQFAIRLERARMQQYGIAMRYLPTINTNLYSPSLFSSSGGTYSGTFLDGKDTRLNMSISYSLDNRLSEWDNYQQSKARYEREKIKVADELMDHKNKVQSLRASMNEYYHWRSYMKKLMAHMLAKSPQSADEYVERTKSIYNMKMELLEQESSAIESEASAVLEYGMPDDHTGAYVVVEDPDSKKK